MKRKHMPMGLRTRILLTCLLCMLCAMLLQMLLFNASSSGVISEQTAGINASTLRNLSDDVYARLKNLEDSLIGVYRYKDFLRSLGGGQDSAQLRSQYTSLAYEMANAFFEPSENLVALYLYTMDHQLISSYRHAQTPIYSYPEDIYDHTMKGSDIGVRELVEKNAPVMAITGYDNPKRQVRLLRCVLRILENAQTPIGYMVCDVDPKGFRALMEKYRYSTEQGLWLQPLADLALVGTLPEDSQTLSMYAALALENSGGPKAKNGAGQYVLYRKPIRKYALEVFSLIPSGALYANQTLLMRNTALVFAAVLLVFTLLFSLVSQRLTKPLTRMVTTMGRIKQGETALRLPRMRQDELGILGNEFNEMLDEIESLIARQYQTALQLNDAKYKALQMQVNPHFLYNTLDTMSAIALSQQCPLVSTLCRALSELFRYSLNMGEPLATMEDELKHLKNYLYVMNVRMRDSIHLDLEVPSELMRARLPRLSLQPLVENAIQHGLRDKRGEKRLSISAALGEKTLTISIADNGVGMSQETIRQLLAWDAALALRQSDSIGLVNIQSRLKLLFGEEYGIEIESQPGEGSRVTLHIPAGEEEKPDA